MATPNDEQPQSITKKITINGTQYDIVIIHFEDKPVTDDQGNVEYNYKGDNIEIMYKGTKIIARKYYDEAGVYIRNVKRKDATEEQISFYRSLAKELFNTEEILLLEETGYKAVPIEG